MIDPTAVYIEITIIRYLINKDCKAKYIKNLWDKLVSVYTHERVLRI